LEFLQIQYAIQINRKKYPKFLIPDDLLINLKEFIYFISKQYFQY